MQFERGKLYRVTKVRTNNSRFFAGRLVRVIGDLPDPGTKVKIDVDLTQKHFLEEGDIFMFLQMEPDLSVDTRDDLGSYLVVLFGESVWTTDYILNLFLEECTVEKVT